MSLQIRRGTAAELANITPVTGELIYTTDSQQVYVGDGSTAGGIPVAVGGSGNVSGINLLTTGLVSATGNLYGNNVIATGFVSVAGNITGNYILGNGSQLTGIITSANSISNGTSNVRAATSNGNITVGINGTSNVAVFASTGILVTGLVSASGNITGSYLFGNGSQLTGITASEVGTLSTLSVTGNITGGNVNVQGAQTTVGNIVGGNLRTAGQVSASGNVTGQYFVGNGSALTGITSTYGNSNVAAYLPTYTGNISGGNVALTGIISATGNITGGNVTATNLTGTILTASQTNITSVGTLGSLTVTANIGGGNVNVTANVQGGNLKTTGLISATGNITGGNITATNLTGTILTASQTNITAVGTLSSVSVTANVQGGNLRTAGLISAAGTITGGNLATVGTISSTGNIDGANLNTSGRVLATGNVTGGNITTGGQSSAIGNVAGGNIRTTGQVSASGNITGGNLNIVTDAVIAGNLTVNGTTTTVNSNTVTINDKFINVANNASSAAEADGGGLGVGPVGGEFATFTFNDVNTRWETNIPLSVTGNATGGNLVTAGYITATGNVTGNYFFGNGSQLVGVTATGVGTLASLSVTGNIQGGNVRTAGLVSATGNVNGGNVVSAALIQGVTVSSTGNVIGGNITTAGIITVNSGNATVAIVNGGSNAVGNIGSSSKYFNTVFAQASTALYADLAECYLGDAEYTPGTVVSFGGDAEVTVSNLDHDPAVAGVVSTNPAYQMNSGLTGDHVVTVALVGRVPCRVQGSVRKGSLMVSAGNGRARAEIAPAAGTIIGKALESFDGDVGTIEIVVGKI